MKCFMFLLVGLQKWEVDVLFGYQKRTRFFIRFVYVDKSTSVNDTPTECIKESTEGECCLGNKLSPNLESKYATSTLNIYTTCHVMSFFFPLWNGYANRLLHESYREYGLQHLIAISWVPYQTYVWAKTKVPCMLWTQKSLVSLTGYTD